VLQAAHAVRTAVKSVSDGEVMHPEAIGGIHRDTFLAFMDVLARRDPAGPAKLLLAFDPEYGATKAKLDSTYAQLVAQYSEPALVNAMKKINVGNYNPMNQGGMNGTGYQLLIDTAGNRATNGTGKAGTIGGAPQPCTPKPGLIGGGKGQAIGCDPNGGQGKQPRSSQPN